MPEELKCPVCGKEMKPVFMTDTKSFANLNYYRCKDEMHKVEVTTKV